MQQNQASNLRQKEEDLLRGSLSATVILISHDVPWTQPTSTRQALDIWQKYSEICRNGIGDAKSCTVESCG